MKKAWVVACLTLSVFKVSAQAKPSILTSPSNWQFEQFSLPPGFAPTVSYHGREELRFSPGWDKKDATDYFTIIWGFRFDDTKSVSAADIKKFLQTYFRGLCSKTATDRHLSPIDSSAVNVSIQKKTTAGKSSVYNLTLHLFGVFADASPVTLNGEIKVMEDDAHQKVYLLMIASPQDKANSIWQDLYKVQREFVIPSN